LITKLAWADDRNLQISLSIPTQIPRSKHKDVTSPYAHLCDRNTGETPRSISNNSPKRERRRRRRKKRRRRIYLYSTIL
jgi:hypothetical protein